MGNADIWMHGRPDFRPAPLQRTGSDCFGGPSQGGCGIMVAAWEGVIWRTGPEVSGEGDRRRVRARLPARSARHSAGRRRVCVHSLQGAAQVIGRTARVCLGVCVHSLQGAAQVIGRTARVCLGVCVHSLQGAAQVIGLTAGVCLRVCVCIPCRAQRRSSGGPPGCVCVCGVKWARAMQLIRIAGTIRKADPGALSGESATNRPQSARFRRFSSRSNCRD